MNAEKFWSGWLKVTMIMIIVAGGFLAIFSQVAYSAFLNEKLDAIFFGGDNPGDQVLMLKNWLTGIAGAVMLGWGFSMLYVVNHPFRNRQPWAWRSIFYPVLCWYLIDSGISAYYGVLLNVIINTILFLQIIAPLLFLRSNFFELNKTVS